MVEFVPNQRVGEKPTLTHACEVLRAWDEHFGTAGERPSDPKVVRQPFMDASVSPTEASRFRAEMDLLYAASAAAHPAFEVLLRALVSDAGNAGNVHDNALLYFKLPPLKTRKTAEDKLRRGGASYPAASLTDIVRATVVCPSFPHLMEVARALQGNGAVVSLKDRFNAGGDDAAYDTSRNKPDELGFKGAQGSGYRDINLLVRVPVIVDEAATYVVSELQLNLPSMLAAKEAEHPVYEIVRVQKAFGTWYADEPHDDPRLTSGCGAAFDAEAERVVQNSENYTPYAVASARGYRAFRERHGSAGGAVACSCGSLACKGVSGSEKDGPRVASIAMLPMSEVVDGASKRDRRSGEVVPGRHLGAQLEWISDVVRVRANAFSRERAFDVLAHMFGDGTGVSGSGGGFASSSKLRCASWCTERSPAAILVEVEEARGLRARRLDSSARLSNDLQDSLFAQRRETLGVIEDVVDDADSERVRRARSWAEGRPKEFSLVDVDFLNGICAKLPRRQDVVWRRDEEKRSLVASLRSFTPGSGPRSGATGVVAKPLGAASSRVKPFLSGSTSAGTVKERVYAKDDMALRRAPPPPSEDASSDARSWTRSLFDDYVLFFPQEMAGLVALMPRLYDVFLQVRGVEDADEAKRRVLEMSAWSGSRR